MIMSSIYANLELDGWDTLGATAEIIKSGIDNAIRLAF